MLSSGWLHFQCPVVPDSKRVEAGDAGKSKEPMNTLWEEWYTDTLALTYSYVVPGASPCRIGRETRLKCMVLVPMSYVVVLNLQSTLWYFVRGLQLASLGSLIEED